MFSLNTNPLSKTTKRSAKRKVKYIIIASISGIIYGAFKPHESERAQEYLDILRKNEIGTTIDIYHVSNLNQFLSSIKYAKPKTGIFIPVSADTKCQHELVSDGD